MNPNSNADSLQIGQIFEGKFKILRELGRGGFGMVYLAYQQPMDRYVALKALRAGIGLTAPSAKERFLREVRIISKLKHPNTVTIHDFGETADGGLYMTLEYVEGETLKQLLKREHALDPVRAAHIARQIAKSLSEAHRLGIVHRDLKPANIMITNLESEKDFVKVLDFGVARLLDPKTSDLTSVGLPEGERELIGTPRYMSPEQVRGEQLAGASDIYSLGLILYEAVSGEAAVLGESTMGLISQQISPEALRLPLLGSLDPMLQDIIRICTAKAVHDRFQTAEQVSDALEQFLNKTRSGRNALAHDYGQQASGWNQNSAWVQQSGHPQGQPNTWGNDYNRNQYGSGQQPSGQYPQQQNPYQTLPPQPNPYQTLPPQAAYPQQGPYPQGGHVSGQYPAQNPYQTMQPQQSPFQGSGYPQQYPGQSGLPPAPGIASSGSLPIQGNGDFPEIQFSRNAPPAPDPEDFQATVERTGLDREALRAAAGIARDRSVVELPPPPADERPFQTQTGAKPTAAPVPHTADRTSAARPAITKNDDDLMSFSLEVVKVLGLVSVFLVVGYVSFLVLGAALATYADGPLRVISAVAVIGVLVLLAVMGETGQRERFQVVTRPTDKAVKILISSIVFTLAAGMLSAALEANGVVRELRTEPNWFLANEESKLAKGNRNLSFTVADGVAYAMGALGLYDDRRGNVPPQKTVVQPTRRSNRTPLKPAESDENPPAEAKPRTADEPKKSDYVKW